MAITTIDESLLITVVGEMMVDLDRKMIILGQRAASLCPTDQNIWHDEDFPASDGPHLQNTA